MKKSLKRNIAWTALIFWGFLIGIFAGDTLSSIFKKETLPEKKYSFINPELGEKTSPQKYVPFELNTTKEIFENIEIKNPEVSLSVYVRNLDNWPWFGIDEDDIFAPIESLKMPLFIAYLKWSEENPSILQKTIEVPAYADIKDENLTQATASLAFSQNILDETKKYTIEALLSEMMVKSSDQAMVALRDEIDEWYLIQVDSDLGLISPGGRGLDGYISLKEYSSFFRILYNAAYLSRKSSELALSILTQTDFEQGISYWVGSNISVANKFWERVYDVSGKIIHQIHDCGIVYYTPYPYIVCISARWDTPEKLPNIIGETAKIIQEQISKAYPQ